MPTLKKLLYITDQDEYVDHSFITPLFETYLKKYLTVDIVYFTEFKSDFERKDTHRFTVPARYKNVLLAELYCNDVPIDAYDYVMVRNDISIMKHVLRQKDKYHYKTAFRLSFPKRIVKMTCDNVNNSLCMRVRLLAALINKFKTKRETKIINKCDAFLPTSESMHQSFFPHVNITTILCPAGINPKMLHPNIQHTGKEKRFFYAGTLDKVREFETVLEAFSNVKNKNWHLSISTRDKSYALEMIEKYENLKKNITVHNAQNRKELLHLIAETDVGVALLPDIPIYNTSTPVKILDYYSSAVPCLMTESEHVNSIFTDCIDAWYCAFDKEDIQEKIEYIIDLEKDKMAEVGRKGQERLLKIRNYEKIAEDLATKLQAL